MCCRSRYMKIEHKQNTSYHWWEDTTLPQDWPPSSPNLNPLEYHVWKHVAEKACATSHSNIDIPKANVDQEWAALLDTNLIKARKVF